VVPRHAPDQVITPASIHQVPPQPGRLAFFFVALAKAFTRKFDLVFCGHLYLAPLAALIARLKGAKLIVQAHGIEAWSRPVSFQRAAVERADLVLCVSRHTRAAVLSWAAVVPERVLVVPNTVGEAFTPGTSSLRRLLSLDEKRVLLTVGRMDSRERYKGHDRVILALPKLVEQGHDVIYVVVGDGEDRTRLEYLAQEVGIAERVLFLGLCEPQKLPDLYRMADIFVMPSTGEGFGIAFLEAMACGTPVVGLAVMGARDALADGELGTATSEANLAQTISRLLAQNRPDPSQLASRVRARFGRAVFVERLRRLLTLSFGDGAAGWADH
jgi:phosphatidylinositol alpha-1,6-mannosyltransferase